RLRIRPGARLAAEFLLDIFLPLNLAGAGFEAGEITVRAQRVDECSVNGRRRPSLRIKKIIRAAYVADASCPDGFTILGRESLNELILKTAIAHQVNSLTDNRRRRIAVPYVVHLPEQLRSLGRPLF